MREYLSIILVSISMLLAGTVEPCWWRSGCGGLENLSGASLWEREFSLFFSTPPGSRGFYTQTDSFVTRGQANSYQSVWLVTQRTLFTFQPGTQTRKERCVMTGHRKGYYSDAFCSSDTNKQIQHQHNNIHPRVFLLILLQRYICCNRNNTLGRVV